MEYIKTAEQYAELTRQKRKLESQINDLKKQIAPLETALLAEHQASGLGSSFKLADGGTVVISENYSARIEDKESCADWFLHNDMKEMLTVNSRTLTSFCKKEAAKGDPIPTGVTISEYKKVMFRQ